MDVPGFLALFYVVAIHRKSLHGTYRPKDIVFVSRPSVKRKLYGFLQMDCRLRRVILRDVFKELPVELEESAWVDGASRFGSFLRIAVPLAAPAIAVAAVICFAFAWNQFLFGLILTYDKAQPVTVIIAGVEHTQGIQFWFVATRLLSAIVPPSILALLAQRSLVRALTFGAIKG